MKRLPLVVFGIIASLVYSTIIPYIGAETAPSYIRQWGSEGLQTTGLFSFPQDLALDSAGNVYVTDYGNRRIQKFDSDGNFLHTWGVKGSGNGQFQVPAGIAIGKDFVYVVDNELNRVQKFDTSGKYITQWGSKGTESGQFLLPQNIAVDPNGDVYVADTGNSRIQKFSSDGKFLLSLGSSGLGNGQFLNPRGVSADSQGSVYVSDSGNNRIQKFTLDGVFLKSFDVSSGNSLRYPQGLDVDSSGNIYVADTGNNRIVKIDKDGNSLASWGSLGTTNGNFNNPKDAVVDSTGNVFVVDSSNHRIQKFGKTSQSTTESSPVQLSPLPNDKTNPVITAPSNITVEANGILSTISIGQATATDASGIASLVNNAPAKFPLGATVVTWTATDAAGNVAKATQTVTVVDTTSPVIAAPPSVTVEASNPDSNSVELGNPSTSDTVGVAAVTNDAPPFFKIGDTIVTWTATDAAGNSASSKQVITVQDTTKPKISAPSNITIEATSASDNNVVLGDATVTDNGEIKSIINDGLSVFPLGTTIITWTATDAAGNVATDTQTIKVVDTTVPTITPPSDVVFEAVSPTDNAVSIGQAIASDIQYVTITNNAPSVFPLGETIVTWNATDTGGYWSVATQKVTVVDTTSPILIPPTDVTIEASSPDHNVVSIGEATAQDAIGILSVSNNTPSYFAFGKTVVTWMAVDISGNSVSANQTITLVDTTPPQLTVPKDVVSEATDPTLNIVQIGDATAFDTIGVDSVTNNSPDAFPIGLTTVTWTAKDTSGNIGNATQTITVRDTTSPMITAPSDITVEAASLSGNTIFIGEANASDITGISSIKNDAPSVFPLGETTITWTATDQSGNSAQATQKITVVDTTAPAITVPDDIIFEALSPTENIVSIGIASGTDIIDSNPTITNNAPSVFTLGETIVTWTATDAAGNSAIGIQKITVVDTTTPTIVAPDDVEAEANSATENTITLGQATAADFVGIESITNDAPAVFPVGETIVTWTATDTTGLVATATQKVMIEDTTPPILKVPESITVEATSESANIVNIGEAKASDLVGIQSITNDAQEVFPLGLTSITWTATDVSGLSYSAIQKVTVVDTTSPILTVPADVVFEAASATNNPVEIGQSTAIDLIRVSSITNNAPSVFPLGETIVTWTATDQSGNSISGTQKVTVVDTTAPTIVIPDDVTIEALSLDNNVVSLGDASADDNVGVIAITNDAPTVFEVGNTMVTWTATDAAGNISSASQTVTVVDTTKPSILSPEDISVEATDPLQNFVILGNATASDTTGIATITNDASTAFAFGKTTVTWTATDTSGNSASDTQTVTVIDTTSPKISAPADVTLEATSLTSNMISIGTATAKDIMGIDSITNDGPDTFSFGETIITWTATDPSGNSATVTQKITVIDTTGPKLTVPDDLTIDATSLETIVPIGTATAVDIIDSNPTITNNAPSVFPLGETIVTWTATDQFGNSENLKQTITVQACGKPVSSFNLIIGGQQDDVLTGTNLADLIFGLEGNDIITGEEGDDCIIAGEGDDIVFGNDGEDKIAADNGNDIIRGGSGEDKINGNSGFDIIDGGDDHDSCNVGENTNDDLITKCETGKL
ncbi:MAG TPA: HYR domain-containing protein [Nitrosopumilaceae archaeon]|nr:HYR domain-containing protein [Nitrosopumilaceae archaeon]